jgi:hypothetical protein
MRLGLSETTCPQRLREQNPVKIVFVLYDSEPNRSCSRLCPLFLLVCVIVNIELKFMLKFANAALEILLEFGMRYPCQSLAIDKCRLLIRY